MSTIDTRFYGIEYDSTAAAVQTAAQKSDIAKVAELALAKSSLGLTDLKNIKTIFEKKYRSIKPGGKKISIPILGSLANTLFLTYHKKTYNKLLNRIEIEEKWLKRLNQDKNSSNEEIRTTYNDLIQDIVKNLPQFSELSESEQKYLCLFLASRTTDIIKKEIAQIISDRNFESLAITATMMQGRQSYFSKLIESSAFPRTYNGDQNKVINQVRNHLKNDQIDKAQEIVDKTTDSRLKAHLQALINFQSHQISKQTTTAFIAENLNWYTPDKEKFDKYTITTATRNEFIQFPHIVLEEKTTGNKIVLARAKGVQHQFEVSKEGSLIPEKNDILGRFFLIRGMLEAHDYSSIPQLFRFEESKSIPNPNRALVEDLLRIETKDPSAIVVQLRACALLKHWKKEVDAEPFIKMLESAPEVHFFLTPQEAEILKLSPEIRKKVVLQEPSKDTGTVEANKKPPSKIQGKNPDQEIKNPEVQAVKQKMDEAAPKASDQVKKELKNIYAAMDIYTTETKKTPEVIIDPLFRIIALNYSATKQETRWQVTKQTADKIREHCTGEFEKAKAQLYGSLIDNVPKGSQPPPLEAIYFAFVQGDLGKVIPGIKPDDLTHVQELVRTILDKHQQMQKAERVSKSLNDKEPANVKELQSLLASTRAYAPIERPHFQVFEVLLNIFMRPAQVENIEKLLADESIALQMLMGGGKTAVLLPLIALMKANGTNLSTVMLPEFILSSEGGILREKLGGFFERFVYEFPEMKVGASQKELEEIHQNLEIVQKSRGCVFITPARKHAFVNNMKWILEACKKKKDKNEPLTPELVGELKAAAKIWLLMKEHESVIGDELDDLLKTSLQFIISLGDPEDFPLEESQIIAQLVVDISQMKELGLDFFPDVNDPSPLSEEDYDKKVLPELIKNTFKRLADPKFTGEKAAIWAQYIRENESHIKTFLSARYDDVQGAKEAEAWVNTLPPEYKNQLAGLRTTLLSNLLSACNSHFNSEYGLGSNKDGEDKAQIAIPYAGPGKPSETRFSSPYQLIVKTVQAYIKKGKTPKELDELIPKFCKEVKKPSENIKSTSQNLFMSSRTFSGITGTMWNINTMPKFDEIFRDYLTEGKSFSTLFAKTQKKENEEISDIAMSAVDSTSPEILIQEIKNQNALTFIDVGGWLRSESELDFAKRILKETEFKSVVFHNDKGEKVVLDRDKDDTRSFNQNEHLKEVKLHERFTIYSKAYTTGTDILQAPNARGLVTVGKDNIARDFLQGSFRMRQLLDNQKLTILSDPETRMAMENAISFTDKENHHPTFVEMLAFLTSNQVNRVLDDNYQSAHQRAETFIETTLLKKILTDVAEDKFDDALNLFTDQRKYFVGGDSGSAWDQFGHIPTPLNSKEKIQKDIERNEETIKKLGLPDEVAEDIRECFGNISLFKEKLDSLEPAKADQVVQQQLSQSAQAQVEQERVEQQQQQLQAKQAQLEKERIEQQRLQNEKAEFDQQVNVLNQKIQSINLHKRLENQRTSLLNKAIGASPENLQQLKAELENLQKLNERVIGIDQKLEGLKKDVPQKMQHLVDSFIASQKRNNNLSQVEANINGFKKLEASLNEANKTLDSFQKQMKSFSQQVSGMGVLDNAPLGKLLGQGNKLVEGFNPQHHENIESFLVAFSDFQKQMQTTVEQLSTELSATQARKAAVEKQKHEALQNAYKKLTHLQTLAEQSGLLSHAQIAPLIRREIATCKEMCDRNQGQENGFKKLEYLLSQADTFKNSLEQGNQLVQEKVGSGYAAFNDLDQFKVLDTAVHQFNQAQAELKNTLNSNVQDIDDFCKKINSLIQNVQTAKNQVVQNEQALLNEVQGKFQTLAQRFEALSDQRFGEFSQGVRALSDRSKELKQKAVLGEDTQRELTRLSEQLNTVKAQHETLSKQYELAQQKVAELRQQVQNTNVNKRLQGQYQSYLKKLASMTPENLVQHQDEWKNIQEQNTRAEAMEQNLGQIRGSLPQNMKHLADSFVDSQQNISDLDKLEQNINEWTNIQASLNTANTTLASFQEKLAGMPQQIGGLRASLQKDVLNLLEGTKKLLESANPQKFTQHQQFLDAYSKTQDQVNTAIEGLNAKLLAAQERHAALDAQQKQRQTQANSLLGGLEQLQEKGFDVKGIAQNIKAWIDSESDTSTLEAFESEVIQRINNANDIDMLSQAKGVSGLPLQIQNSIETRRAFLAEQKQLQEDCAACNAQLADLQKQNKELAAQVQTLQNSKFQPRADLLPQAVNIQNVAPITDLKQYKQSLEVAVQSVQKQVDKFQTDVQNFQKNFQLFSELDSKLEGHFSTNQLEAVHEALCGFNMKAAADQLKILVSQSNNIEQLEKFEGISTDFAIKTELEERLFLLRKQREEELARKAIFEQTRRNIIGQTSTKEYENYLSKLGDISQFKDEKLNTALNQLHASMDQLRNLRAKAVDEFGVQAHYKECQAERQKAVEFYKAVQARVEINKNAAEMLNTLESMEEQARKQKFEGLANAILNLRNQAKPSGVGNWAFSWVGMGAQQLSAEAILERAQELTSQFDTQLKAKQERSAYATEANARLGAISNLLPQQLGTITSLQEKLDTLIDTAENKAALEEQFQESLDEILETCNLEELSVLATKSQDVQVKNLAGQLHQDKRAQLANKTLNTLQNRFSSDQAGIQELLAQANKAAQNSNIEQLQAIEQELQTLQTAYTRLNQFESTVKKSGLLSYTQIEPLILREINTCKERCDRNQVQENQFERLEHILSQARSVKASIDHGNQVVQEKVDGGYTAFQSLKQFKGVAVAVQEFNQAQQALENALNSKALDLDSYHESIDSLIQKVQTAQNKVDQNKQALLLEVQEQLQSIAQGFEKLSDSRFTEFSQVVQSLSNRSNNFQASLGADTQAELTNLTQLLTVHQEQYVRLSQEYKRLQQEGDALRRQVQGQGSSIHQRFKTEYQSLMNRLNSVTPETLVQCQNEWATLQKANLQAKQIDGDLAQIKGTIPGSIQKLFESFVNSQEKNNDLAEVANNISEWKENQQSLIQATNNFAALNRKLGEISQQVSPLRASLKQDISALFENTRRILDDGNPQNYTQYQEFLEKSSLLQDQGNNAVRQLDAQLQLAQNRQVMLEAQMKQRQTQAASLLKGLKQLEQNGFAVTDIMQRITEWISSEVDMSTLADFEQEVAQLFEGINDIDLLSKAKNVSGLPQQIQTAITQRLVVLTQQNQLRKECAAFNETLQNLSQKNASLANELEHSLVSSKLQVRADMLPQAIEIEGVATNTSNLQEYKQDLERAVLGAQRQVARFENEVKTFKEKLQHFSDLSSKLAKSLSKDQMGPIQAELAHFNLHGAGELLKELVDQSTNLNELKNLLGIAADFRIKGHIEKRLSLLEKQQVLSKNLDTLIRGLQNREQKTGQKVTEVCSAVKNSIIAKIDALKANLHNNSLEENEALYTQLDKEINFYNKNTLNESDLNEVNAQIKNINLLEEAKEKLSKGEYEKIQKKIDDYKDERDEFRSQSAETAQEMKKYTDQAKGLLVTKGNIEREIKVVLKKVLAKDKKALGRIE